VFEPFFTTKPVGQGTGLGLDVAWRIVTTRHGGVLKVRSRPGDTRFQVRLPLSETVPPG
jgi:signal transduction histidine kinase